MALCCARPCAPTRRAQGCRDGCGTQARRPAPARGVCVWAGVENQVAASLQQEGTNRASQEAYNRAMQAYSQSPFSYQHEAGLCAC